MASGTSKQHETPRVLHAPVSSKTVPLPVHERTVSPSYSISVQSSGSGPNWETAEKNTRMASTPTAMPAMLSRMASVRAESYRSESASSGSSLTGAAAAKSCSLPHVGHWNLPVCEAGSERRWPHEPQSTSMVPIGIGVGAAASAAGDSESGGVMEVVLELAGGLVVSKRSTNSAFRPETGSPFERRVSLSSATVMAS